MCQHLGPLSETCVLSKVNFKSYKSSSSIRHLIFSNCKLNFLLFAFRSFYLPTTFQRCVVEGARTRWATRPRTSATPWTSWCDTSRASKRPRPARSSNSWRNSAHSGEIRNTSAGRLRLNQKLLLPLRLVFFKESIYYFIRHWTIILMNMFTFQRCWSQYLILTKTVFFKAKGI